MLRVRVETPCRPTESVEKVMQAVRNLFPDARLESTGDRILGVTENLDRLRELIRTQRIRDSARRQLIAGRQGDLTIVSLSKQAAFVGVVNFATSSALGDIRVEIESDNLALAIDYVAESTISKA